MYLPISCLLTPIPLSSRHLSSSQTWTTSWGDSCLLSWTTKVIFDNNNKPHRQPRLWFEMPRVLHNEETMGNQLATTKLNDRLNNSSSNFVRVSIYRDIFINRTNNDNIEVILMSGSLNIISVNMIKTPP